MCAADWSRLFGRSPAYISQKTSKKSPSEIDEIMGKELPKSTERRHNAMIDLTSLIISTISCIVGFWTGVFCMRENYLGVIRRLKAIIKEYERRA